MFKNRESDGLGLTMGSSYHHIVDKAKPTRSVFSTMMPRGAHADKGMRMPKFAFREWSIPSWTMKRSAASDSRNMMASRTYSWMMH